MVLNYYLADILFICLPNILFTLSNKVYDLSNIIFLKLSFLGHGA